MDVRVELRDQQTEVAAGFRYGQALAQFANEFAAAFLMAGVPGQPVPRRRSFAEIVYQRREADLEIVGDLLRLFEHHHDM